ncbi:hypothetical protein ACTXT7_011027 [Hymenolepis weldensis]
MKDSPRIQRIYSRHVILVQIILKGTYVVGYDENVALMEMLDVSAVDPFDLLRSLPGPSITSVNFSSYCADATPISLFATPK